MTLPYTLTVQFDQRTSTAECSGVVVVTAHQGATCRKLRLQAIVLNDAGDILQQLGRAQTVVDWAEWYQGKTYEYPFSLQVGTDTHERYALQTVVHRIGELQPDPAQVWQRPSPTLAMTATLPPTIDSKLPAPVVRPADQHAQTMDLSTAVAHVALSFDRRSMQYRFGEPVTGYFIFTPARDLADIRLGIDYQWRIHGLTERRDGDHRPVSIITRSSWKKDEEYTIPFSFSIPSGPPTSRAHSEKLNWYVWPVLLPLDGSAAAPLIQAESEIDLLPPPEEQAVHIQHRTFHTSHLLNTVLLTFVGLLATVFFGAYWLGSLFGGDLDGYSGSLFLGSLVLVGVSIVQFLDRGLTELSLGRVRVTLAGEGDVRATVALRPRRPVHLQSLQLSVRVTESLIVGQGSAATSTTWEVYSDSVSIAVDETIDAGQAWSTTLSAPLPHDLPVEARTAEKDNERYTLRWSAMLQIMLDGHNPWQKHYALSPGREKRVKRKRRAGARG